MGKYAMTTNQQQQQQGTTANALPYRAAWGAFWSNLATLQQIVQEDFPDGDADDITPTRYQVDALRDLAGRLGALVAGHIAV